MHDKKRKEIIYVSIADISTRNSLRINGFIFLVVTLVEILKMRSIIFIEPKDKKKDMKYITLWLLGVPLTFFIIMWLYITLFHS